jgi:tetratricopeptide (TPR) repeat protein
LGENFTQLERADGRQVYIPSRPEPMRILALSSVLSLLLLAAASPALAGPEPSPSEISVARRLFDEGKAAEDAGRFREAAERFRKAAAIKDTPGIRFHLAHSEEEQGNFVEALVEYDRARELIDAGVKAADVEKLLPAARERVRAKVALLTLRVPRDVANVSVELDGKKLSSSVMGVPMPINPGKHLLSATAAGRSHFESDVQLGAGEARQVAIELPPATTVPAPAPAGAPPPPAVAPPRAASDDVSTIRPRTAVLIGEASLFVASLATGIVFTVARNDADSRYRKANDLVLSQVSDEDPSDSACGEPLMGCAELDEAGRDRSRAGTLATVGFIAAGASAAAFGLTWILWPDGDAPAKLSAKAGPRGAALTLSAHF